MFSLPAGAANPLPVGPAYHQFKNEIPDGCEIVEFYTLGKERRKEGRKEGRVLLLIPLLIGPKLYMMSYVDLATGEYTTLTKVKGFYLRSARAKQALDDERFRHFVDAFLRNEDCEASVAQWNIRTTRDRHLHSQVMEKVLKNSMYSKRVAFRGGSSDTYKNRQITLPFGYTATMFHEIISGAEAAAAVQ